MFDLRHDGPVARLTLRRPEARNAIPIEGWSMLAERAREAEGGGARLLILAGAGDAFCAGADLAEFPAMIGDEAAAGRFRQALRAGLDAVAGLAIPSIAAVSGPCYGAGVALAMACDLRLAGPGAAFAITPAKLGISYPQEDIHRLAALVGPGQAARLLLGAGRIDGAEAERIGLVERNAGGAIEEELETLAGAIAANSHASLATLKRGIRMALAGCSTDSAQDRVFDTLITSDDLAVSLAALRGG